MRNVVLGVVAVLAIGVAIFLTLGRSSHRIDLPTTFTVKCVCLACEKESEGTYPLGTCAPYPCPFCKKMAVYPWFYCEDCNKRVIPDLVRPDPKGPLRLPMGLQCPCPSCHSNHVVQYDPAMPNQHPVGDAPLPKWSE